MRKVEIKNNTGVVNIYNIPGTKMELSAIEEEREVATLRKMDKDTIVMDYLEHHDITYLDQIIIENVLAYSNVVLIHEITKELEMRSIAKIMVKQLELVGYPAGTKLEGLKSSKITDVTKISVYTNTPIIVFYRAMAAAKKALASMEGNHKRTIDMKTLKKGFPELYKAGMKIIKGKDGTAESLKKLIEEYIGAPYETFDKLAKMKEEELIKYFENKKPSK